MPGGHSKFDEATGKWSPAIPLGAAVVRKSAGWIDSKERFIWVVYLVGNGKRVYIRGHNESLNPKAFEHAKNDAQEIVDAIGGFTRFYKADGFKDTWSELLVS